MSKISFKPADTGTATFTLEAPATNTNRTITLPDEAGTLATVENLPSGYTDSDALDLFNVTGSAPVYACRAWVNFDGTGTVSIRESGNVSSITDNGIGDYTFNFTTAMPDVNYSFTALGTGGGAFYQIGGGSQGAGTIRNLSDLRTQFGYVRTFAGGIENQDPVNASIHIFR